MPDDRFVDDGPGNHGLGDATLRAEDSTVQLRATIDVLQERIKKAESLRDDLVFLVERGNGTADALEELVRTARDKVGVMPGTASRDTLTDEEPMRSRESLASTSQSAPKAGAEALSNGDQMSDAERELLRALRSAS